MKQYEEISLADYRRLTSSKRRRPLRLDIPRAAADERVGMTTLLKAGWSYRCNDRVHQFWRGEQRTAEHEDLKAACQEAKALEREQRCTASPNKF